MLVRDIVDSNLYATLATADAEGGPWASPVWFAHEEGYGVFLWVSRPEARHSRNLPAWPEIALVVFDSTTAPGDASAVYAEGRGEELEKRKTAHADAIEERRWGGKMSNPIRLYMSMSLDGYITGPGDRPVYCPQSMEQRQTEERTMVIVAGHSTVEPHYLVLS